MKSSAIGIIIGEDSDIPAHIIKEHQLTVYPFNLTWELLPKSQHSDIYKIMRSSKKTHPSSHPTTSQPSVGTFKTLFQKGLSQYKDILVFTISAKLSGCYNSALQAQKLFSPAEQKRIHLIDSKTGSVSEALLILKAIDYVKNNFAVSKILSLIKSDIPETHLLGTGNDPFWLGVGGRISPTIAMVMTQLIKLGIRPIVTVKDGVVTLLKVKMNAFDVVEVLSTQLGKEIEPYGDKPITVALSHGDDESNVLKLKKIIEKKHQNVTIKFINTTSPVLGAHLGPNIILVGWMV